jgi:hypothetical protein
MRRLRSLLTRERIDPNRIHPFRATNDGNRGGFASAQSNNATLFAVPVRREFDPRRVRCEVPGCRRLRDDPIHGAPED